MKSLAALLILSFAVGCASSSSRETAQEKPASPLDEIEPLGDGKKVCGWSDSGRWECSTATRTPAQKPKSKFSTKFKKTAPSAEKEESKLPRGDTPVQLEPIDEDDGL